MKKLIFVLTGLMLVGAGCFQKPATAPQDQSANANDAPTAAQEPVAPSIEDSINGDAVAVYEGGELQSLRSAQGNIYVIAPLPGSVIGDTLTVSGNARVFENIVNYRVKDASGAVISSGYTVANSPDIGQYGAYQLIVDLSAVSDQPLAIEVYWASAKDGSDADLVSFIVNKQ